MLRFLCLGFNQPSSEEDAMSLLEQIAQVARHESHQTLVYEPFKGCTVSISLDEFGDPKTVNTILESECQKFIFDSYEADSGMIRLFGSFEERAVMPIKAKTASTISNFEMGSPIFGDLWGFAESSLRIEPAQPLFASEFLENGSVLARGLLIRKWEETNQITGKSVNLAEVYSPCVKSIIAFANPISAEIGSYIEYSPDYFFRQVS